MRRIFATGVIVALAGVLAGSPGFSYAQAAAPWPTFHGSSTRNGSSSGNGPTTGVAANRWSLPQGIVSSPVVDASGIAYIGDVDGNVYALDPSKPSAPKWTFTADTKVVGTPTLSADGKTLYVGTTGGNLYAVDTSTGKAIWSKPTPLGGSIQASPLLSSDGSTLFVPNVNGAIYAINAASGAVNCTRPSGGAIQGSLTLSPDGATVYAATNNGVMVGMPASGNQICTTAGSVFYLAGPATSSPAVDANGVIYVASGSSKGQIMAFSPGSSTPQWTYSLPLGVTAPSTPAIGLGFVAFGASDKHIYVLNQTNGQVVWNRPTGDVVESSPAIAAGNRMMYFGSDDGNVWAYDASANQIWVKVTGAAIRSSLALGADSSLWAASTSGVVYRMRDVGLPPSPGPTPVPGTTPTPTPTATPTTTTPTPTTTTTQTLPQISMSAKKQVKVGKKQTVTIKGTANTVVHIRVTYPNGDHQSHAVTIGANGTAKYTYVQGASKILHNRFYATVQAKAGTAPLQATVTAQYKILFGRLDLAVEPRTQAVGKTVNIWIHASPRVKVFATLTFPNRKFKRLSGKTGPKAWAHLRYKVAKKMTKGKNHKVTVVAGYGRLSTKTTFTIK